MNTESSRHLVDVFVVHSLTAAGEQEHNGHGAEQFEACLALHGVVHLRSYLSADGRRMLCHFNAPDADSLRAALRVSHIDYDAVWTAKVNELPGAGLPARKLERMS